MRQAGFVRLEMKQFLILASNQPYFLPYIGYWQLINAADVFEICDDFNYIKGGWVNRNRILINGQAGFYNIEINHATSNKKINELYLADFSVEKKLKQIQNSYSRSPYFESCMELMNRIFSCPDRNLADFLTFSIREICAYLGISTKIIRSSEYVHDRSLKKQYGIFDSCKLLGMDTYYNAIGGMELYSFEEFHENGLQLAFLKTGNVCYRQFGHNFVPNLSILDVMMFNSVPVIQEMLEQYQLIDEDNRGDMPEWIHEEEN